MNCLNCDAHREDLQTGDHYCRDLGVMLSPGAVECPRQQAENGFREHIIGRFTRKD